MIGKKSKKLEFEAIQIVLVKKEITGFDEFYFSSVGSWPKSDFNGARSRPVNAPGRIQFRRGALQVGCFLPFGSHPATPLSSGFK
ncbi:hypothetical protein [Achromobacter kerstersii]